ncbi:hypothetical protein PIB30_062398 [Stylosanthes scabra]|uniref:RING-type domain-containing protein n=1 Tax=Stylosanthes scabra TaxID=79078 RepID=A0ABU6QLQ1_9FABA|nr:hypothetical protein [Stylosanthes scabra]
MGFPVGYTEVLVPNIFLRLLTFLAALRNLVLSLFRLLGISELLDTTSTDTYPLSWAQAHQAQFNRPNTTTTTTTIPIPSLSAILIREFLPVMKFSDLAGAGDFIPATTENGCAVCLSEFSGEDEIRCMANCRHVFHSGCVDRWMDHDQRTCPLCRTPFVPDHKVNEYNQRLWEASGATEFYAD